MMSPGGSIRVGGREGEGGGGMEGRSEGETGRDEAGASGKVKLKVRGAVRGTFSETTGGGAIPGAAQEVESSGDKSSGASASAVESGSMRICRSKLIATGVMVLILSPSLGRGPHGLLRFLERLANPREGLEQIERIGLRRPSLPNRRLVAGIM